MTYNSNLELVFVNACHSEEVGRVFLEAGVRSVVAIQSELKIEDKAAQSFSECMYKELLNGETVKKSFELA